MRVPYFVLVGVVVGVFANVLAAATIRDRVNWSFAKKYRSTIVYGIIVGTAVGLQVYLTGRLTCGSAKKR